MSKSTLLFIALILLTSNRTEAQNANVDANTNSFSAKLMTERENNVILGYRCVIEFNSNKFAAIFPANYRVQQDRQRHRIVATSQDRSCVLTLSFTNALILGKDQEFDHQSLQNRLAGQFQGAKIVDETWQFALENQAPTFDLLRRTAAGETHRARVSFVSTAKALVTVAMTSTQDRFQHNAFAFADLLASLLQADEDGKLEINPLSNKL